MATPKKYVWYGGLLFVTFSIIGLIAFYPGIVGTEYCATKWINLTNTVNVNVNYSAVGRYYCNSTAEVTRDFCLKSHDNYKGCVWAAKITNSKRTAQIILDPILETPFFTYNFSVSNLNNVSLCHYSDTELQTCTSIYDSLIVSYSFNNNSLIGENGTHVVNQVSDGKNGSVTGTLRNDWNSLAGRNSGTFNFHENSTAGDIRSIQFAQTLTNESNISFSVWIKPNNYMNFAGGRANIVNILGNYDVWVSWKNSSQRCFLTGHNSSVSSDWDTSGGNFKSYVNFKNQDANDCPVGNWSHFAGTVTPNGVGYNVTIYINGLKYFTGETHGGGFPTGPATSFIGMHTGYPQFEYLAFNGSIDDLMIWNRTLTDSEVSDVYLIQFTKFNPTNYTVNFYNNTNFYLNYTFNNYTANYSICYSNITTNGCSNNFTASFDLPIVNVISYFLTKVGNINRWYYGVNYHTGWFSGGQNIRNYSNAAIRQNLTYHLELKNNANLTYLRNDQSISSYYDVIPPLDFENDWINTSFSYNGSGVTNVDPIFSVNANLGQYGNGTLYRTTDSHSGNYALVVNTTNGYNYVITALTNGGGDTYWELPNGTAFNISVWAKGQGTFQLAIQDTSNGYTSNCNAVGKTLTSNWQQFSNICTTNTTLYHKYRITIDAIRANITLDDMNITYQNGSSIEWYRKGNITVLYNDYQTNHQRGDRSLEIASYTPSGLANISSGCYYLSTTTGYRSCAARSWDLFAILVVDYYDRITGCEGNQTCRNQICDIDNEVWNEPYNNFLLNGDPYNVTDHPEKNRQYNMLYNATYTRLRAAYPCISIGGPSASIAYIYSPNMIDGFLSNFSNRMDFFSWHPYWASYTTDNFMTSSISSVLARCSYYNANCSRIVASEWSSNSGLIGNSTTIGVTSSQSIFEVQLNWDKVETDNLIGYFQQLNYVPDNISNNIYQWSSGYYLNYTPYTDGGAHYDMVDETDKLVYPVYTATANLSKYCPALGEVYVTNSTDNVWTVACKFGNKQTLIIINARAISRKIVVDVSGSNISSFKDQFGNTYSVVNNQSSVILDQYKTVYLSNAASTATLSAGISSIRFSPSYLTQTNLYPTGSNSTVGLFNISNIALNSGNMSVRIKINATQPGWAIKCYVNNNSIVTLNSSYQVLPGNQIDQGQSMYIWCLADLSNPTSAFRGRISVDSIYL